jgi:hypothetical protein
MYGKWFLESVQKIFSADFTAAHDHYMKRKRKRMEKEAKERELPHPRRLNAL